MTTLPNPPEGGPDGGPPAPAWEPLMQSLQDFATQNGYGLIRRQGGNYRDGEPTRFYIYCDRGQRRTSQGQGIRDRSTRKIDCPWKGRIKASKGDDWCWSFKILHEHHNHGASERRRKTMPGFSAHLVPPGSRPLAAGVRSYNQLLEAQNVSDGPSRDLHASPEENHMSFTMPSSDAVGPLLADNELGGSVPEVINTRTTIIVHNVDQETQQEILKVIHQRGGRVTIDVS